MKKNYIIVLLICTLGAAGCSDFLNLVPKNKTIVANLEDVKAELYAYLGAITYSTGLISPSYGGATFRFPFYNEVAARLCLYEDDIDMTHFTDHKDVNSNCVGAYNEAVDWKGTGLATGLWGSCYGTIGFMNAILDDLKRVGGSEAEYETMAGEIKVIRAYHIFKLLQYFAPYHNDKLGIPLNLDSENVKPSDRWTQTAVYEVLIQELNEVLQFKTGPEKWNIFYSPEIAKALLAQVYWFKASSAAAAADDWKNAEKYSKELIAGYIPEESAETLTEIFSSGVKEYVTSSPHYLLRFSYNKAWKIGDPRTGFWAQGNAQRISNELLNLYGPDDIRLKAWFKYIDDEGQAFYGINKPVYTQSISEISVLFRRADLYLINAEAHYHLNNLSEARVMLVAFKSSRSALHSDFKDEDILNEILLERRKEFCYEMGTRWLDMKRLSVKVTRMGMNKEGKGTKEYVLETDDYRYAFPIPNEIELDYNKIEQNPGWGNVN